MLGHWHRALSLLLFWGFFARLSLSHIVSLGHLTWRWLREGGKILLFPPAPSRNVLFLVWKHNNNNDNDDDDNNNTQKQKQLFFFLIKQNI